MGLHIELCLFSFLLALTGVYGGEHCYNFDDGDWKWCSYGCCGYLDNECCDANVALIIGMVVLAVLVISTIIAVVCCCMRRRAAHGQVINTNPGVANPGVVVTNSTTMMGQPAQPYAYGTQTYPPGTYIPPSYPMGAQPPPQPYGAPAPAQPYGGAMAPPSYDQVAGQGGQQFKPPVSY